MLWIAISAEQTLFFRFNLFIILERELYLVTNLSIGVAVEVLRFSSITDSLLGFLDLLKKLSARQGQRPVNSR